jgi:two-component system LytT family response regulator
MNVVIVEDERPAAERLRTALMAYDSSIVVTAHLQTVADTVLWFATHNAPDLLFLDVRLTDGLSLEIFRTTEVTCPVVFTTAYDAYVLDAFECNSIDYLLKPIRLERLADALRKYDRLRRHFTGEITASLRRAMAAEPPVFRERLIVQKGVAFVSISTHDVSYAFSDQKTTFVVHPSGRRYLCDEALTSLEDLLDPSQFFRLNRKYLTRIDAVASFRQAPRGRIRVELRPPAIDPVMVSREKAVRFRTWMER